MTSNPQSRKNELRNPFFAKFVMYPVVLLLMIILMRGDCFSYSFLQNHFQIILAPRLNQFLFGLFKNPDFIALIFSIWVVVSSVFVLIDYFVFYPIQSNREKNKNGS
jgi:hypothetical protein